MVLERARDAGDHVILDERHVDQSGYLVSENPAEVDSLVAHADRLVGIVRLEGFHPLFAIQGLSRRDGPLVRRVAPDALVRRVDREPCLGQFPREHVPQDDVVLFHARGDETRGDGPRSRRVAKPAARRRVR